MFKNENMSFKDDENFYKDYGDGDTLAVYHKGYQYLFSKLINVVTSGKFDHLLKLYRPDAEGVWISEQTVSRGCVYEKITWKKFKQRFLSDKVNVYHGKLNILTNSYLGDQYAKTTELQKYGFAKLLDTAPILNLFSPFSSITKNKEICSMHVALCDQEQFKKIRLNDNPITKILNKYKTVTPIDYVKETTIQNLYTWVSLTDRYKNAQ